MRIKVEVLVVLNGQVGVCKPTEERGWYTFPGGGVDADETLEEAGIRECLEEVGIEVVGMKSLECEQEFHHAGSGKNSNSCFHFYTACFRRVDETMLDCEGDAREIEWLNLDDAALKFGSSDFDQARIAALENLSLLLN